MKFKYLIFMNLIGNKIICLLKIVLSLQKKNKNIYF